MLLKYTRKSIKKAAALLLAGSLILALAACGSDPGESMQATQNGGSTNTQTGTAADPVTDDSIHASETTAAFSLTTEERQRL